MNKMPMLNERLFLRSPSTNVCFRVTIEGALDKNKIEKALETVAIRHPFLNSFVEIDDENNAWIVQKGGLIGVDDYKSDEMDCISGLVEIDDENNAWIVQKDDLIGVDDYKSDEMDYISNLVEIDDENNALIVQKDGSIEVDYYKSGEMDWQTWYKKTDSTPFVFSQGPLVKFCAIVSENTDLIILGHHIIGDDIAYLNLVKDVLLALDGKPDTTPQLPPFEQADKYFKDTVLLDPGVQSFINTLNEEWKQDRTRFSEEDYLAFFEQYRNKFIPNLYMASIKGKPLKVLLEKCKSNDLTTNETIFSAFSQAIMENLNQDELRLGVTANVRNELISEPTNCMGNYVAGVSAKVSCDPAKDFTSNAKAITGTIGERLSNLKSRHLELHFLNGFDKDLLESIMFVAYGGFEHPVSERLAELIGERSEDKGLGISDLGQHDFTDYDNIKVVDVRFIGPALPANLLTIYTITVNNKLNLCLRYNEGEIKTDTIKAICKKAIELAK